MERREIEVFLTLAAELHFGRTAQRLHLSQARVSQTVAALERRVGAPLFARTSRRVDLTPIGARLRDDLTPAQQQVDAAIARAVAAGRDVAGVLRLGFEAPGVADLARDTLDRFRAEHPDCELRVREVDFADPFALLRTGGVDALVTLVPVDEPDMVVGPTLLSEPVVLAVAAGHPFARRAGVTLEDLARDTVLRAARPAPPYWVDPPGEWVTAAGSPVRRGAVPATFQELLAAVAAGDGVCPLAAHAADFFARPSVAYVPITDGPPVSWALVRPASGGTARVRALAAAVNGRAPARPTRSTPAGPV